MGSVPPGPHLVLFTRDLRVHDHPALSAAGGAGEVVPLFVLQPGLLRRSPNRHRFLLEALRDLDRSLRGLGAGLVVRSGDAVSEAARLARDLGCAAIHLTADVSPFARRRERRLREACASSGIEVRTWPGNAVVEAGAVRPSGADHYRVFTPYLRAWLAAVRRPILPAPRSVRIPAGVDPGRLPDPSSVRTDAQRLPPGGEAPGRELLHRFLRGNLARYGRDRDLLASTPTSRLSPYLRFGCLSAAEVAGLAERGEGGTSFVRQLAWRDFFRQLLAGEPRLLRESLRPRPTAGRAAGSPAADLERWRAGRTGHPLVDAAMRQLRTEGWLPNRARLVAASFLCRTLGIDWPEGAAHFDRLLVDGDPASNAGNWQWVAGTVANPRPNRALDPDRQARRFDPEGEYVRRHLTDPGSRGRATRRGRVR